MAVEDDVRERDRKEWIENFLLSCAREREKDRFS